MATPSSNIPVEISAGLVVQSPRGQGQVLKRDGMRVRVHLGRLEIGEKCRASLVHAEGMRRARLVVEASELVQQQLQDTRIGSYCMSQILR